MEGLDESVTVVPHDPTWADTFEAERRRIGDALNLPLERIEHIGSTAVRGLPAKPVVDIMVGFDGFPPEPALVQALNRLGFRSFGEAGVSGRLYFTRRDGAAVNVHAVLHEHHHWINNLALREYLRAHPERAAEYAKAKFEAVAAGAARLLTYSQSKADFVSELVRQALAWSVLR